MAAISYVPSKEAALPSLPWHTALHPGLSEEGSCWPRGLQAEQLSLKRGVGTSELFTLQQCHPIFYLPFSLEVKQLLQILLTSDSDSFSPRKCKFSPELQDLLPQELSFREEL